MLFTLFTFLLFSSSSPAKALSLHRPSKFLSRQATSGFQLAPTGSLKAFNLTSSCEQVLYQTINCDPFVKTLGAKDYHGSLENTTSTDSVCAKTCGTALSTARRRINGACMATPNLTPGLPVLSLLDRLYTGWNETCLRDNSTSAYCNDIIDAWAPVDDIKDMPSKNLCSYCFGAKLKLMQSSPYSAYDDLYAEQLNYIIKTCKLGSTPTNPLPMPGKVNTTEPICASGKTYTTKVGDTCDTISLANQVSSATLYWINPNLHDCAKPGTGLDLCLPLQCETYTVQKNQSCIDIAVDHNADWQEIVGWNAGVNSRCTNIWGATPSWGATICVSPPGGAFNSTNPGKDPTTPGTGGPGGSGNGFADKVVPAPSGTVAKGTTKNCGGYIQGKAGVSCSSMISAQAVTMDLFVAINPSLKSVAECTANLVDSVWYCLHPIVGWNTTATPARTGSISTTTSLAI